MASFKTQSIREGGAQEYPKDLDLKIEDISDTFDPIAEKKLLRKIDMRLIPMLFALYLCAFIDR